MFLQSHAPDFQYHITYSIEPMLEMLWRADNTQDDTRYKILFPITTPPMPRTPFTDDRKYHQLSRNLNFKTKDAETYCPSGTVPQERYFTAYVGTFLNDVVLKNITFPNGVFTVEESNARGFLIQQHLISNGSFVISLQVPFDSEAVLKHVSKIKLEYP